MEQVIYQPKFNHNLNNQLLDAAFSWNLEAVKELIKEGANPNYRRKKEFKIHGLMGRSVIESVFGSPMKNAPKDRFNFELLKILLESGANINTTKISTISFVYSNKIEMTVFEEIINICIATDNTDLIEFALKYGSPNTLFLTEKEIEGQILWYPLNKAVSSGTMNCALKLIQHGADVNSMINITGSNVSVNSFEANIHLACAIDNVDVAYKMTNLLIENKADVDMKKTRNDFRDGILNLEIQETPLHIAIIIGNVGLVILLLRNGASRQKYIEIKNFDIDIEKNIYDLIDEIDSTGCYYSHFKKNNKPLYYQKLLKDALDLSWNPEIHKYYPTSLRTALVAIFYAFRKRKFQSTLKNDLIFLIFGYLCGIWSLKE